MVEERALREKVAKMADTEAARGILDTLETDYERLEQLTRISKLRTSKEALAVLTKRNLENSITEVEKAEKELHNAWEEAGGVCPMCGSEVKENCIH